MRRLSPLGLVLLLATLVPAGIGVAERASFQMAYPTAAPTPLKRVLAASRDCDFALRREFAQAQVTEILSRSPTGKALLQKLNDTQVAQPPLHLVSRKDLPKEIQTAKKKVMGAYFPRVDVQGVPTEHVISMQEKLPLFLHASLFSHEVQHYLDRFDPVIGEILKRCGDGSTEERKRYCEFERAWSELNAWGEQYRILGEMLESLNCSKDKLMMTFYRRDMSPYDPASSLYQMQRFLAVYRLSRSELKTTLDEIEQDAELIRIIRSDTKHGMRFAMMRNATFQ